MILAVLDTNVLAPGFTGTAGASVALVELWRERYFGLIVSEHILAEFERAMGDS